jgi:hypothetical protein
MHCSSLQYCNCNPNMPLNPEGITDKDGLYWFD